MTTRPACRAARALCALVVAAIWLTLHLPAASAGTWNLAYDFASDLSGWSGYTEPGYLLCGRTATAGCPDTATNRIHLRPGLVPVAWAQGRWEWTAPPGTTIVGGALAYRTRMSAPTQYARVKMRADGQDWGSAPAIVSEQQTGPLVDHIVALPAGYRQLGVALYSHPGAVATAGVWDDYVTLVHLDVTVDDPTPPTLAWVDGGQLTDGAWHRDDVCAVVGAADGQSGVATVTAQAGAASARYETPLTGVQYGPRPAAAQPRLCLSAGALGDGAFSGQVVAADATGGGSAPLGFTVRIDRSAPQVALLQPIAPSPKPEVVLAASDAASGIASIVVMIDGKPVDARLVAGKVRASPTLGYGDHALSWTIGDAAGNTTAGAAVVSVTDPDAPTLAIGVPVDGAVLADGVLASVRVVATDAGSGIDPGGYRISLDGHELTDGMPTATGYAVVVGTRLASGEHRLEATVHDRAGNATSRAWKVSVPAGQGAPAPAAAGAPTAGNPSTPAARAAGRRLRAIVTHIGSVRALHISVRFAVPQAGGAVRVRTRCGSVRSVRGMQPVASRLSVHLACPGAASVEVRQRGVRAITTIAPRQLPLLLVLGAEPAQAPAVVTVRGRLAELAGRDVAVQSLSAGGWRSVGKVRANRRGAFELRFTAGAPGSFALRARVSDLAALPCRIALLTVR